MSLRVKSFIFSKADGSDFSAGALGVSVMTSSPFAEMPCFLSRPCRFLVHGLGVLPRLCRQHLGMLDYLPEPKRPIQGVFVARVVGSSC